jgi:hypothetical protein
MVIIISIAIDGLSMVMYLYYGLLQHNPYINHHNTQGISAVSAVTATARLAGWVKEVPASGPQPGRHGDLLAEEPGDQYVGQKCHSNWGKILEIMSYRNHIGII